MVDGSALWHHFLQQLVCALGWIYSKILKRFTAKFNNSTAPIFLLTTIIGSTINATIKWRNSSRRRAVACNLPVKNSVIHCLEAKPTFTPSIFDYNSPQSQWECLIATDQWCLREVRGMIRRKAIIYPISLIAGRKKKKNESKRISPINFKAIVSGNNGRRTGNTR
ncbi:hypothetical protein CDAR_433051 [Caerostris darwini]|uniref:Uncharacterized protein n=1 Tax=Caerostris darwini TaxID=1538125 RepID=A0AAV4QGQ0_9ARAC|nr:hypothetical protein CDAR_433051 [Caerostris darwini]